MPLYYGNHKCTLYRGDHHPAELYYSNHKICGYNAIPHTGTDIAAENTYNDALPLEIWGQSWQDSYRVGVLTGNIVQLDDAADGHDMIVTADANCTVHQRNTLKPFDNQGNILGKHVIPLLCGAGNVYMTVSGITSYYWVFRNVKYTGTTFSFTGASDGEVLWLVINDTTISSTFQISNGWSSNGTHFKLDLSDLQGKITNTLSLNNCPNITGSLADLQGKITNTLSLGNCSNITGSLADLQGKITYYLSLYNCSNITGNLADLQGKITNTLSLGNCSNITGNLADLQGKITDTLSLGNCSNITGSYLMTSPKSIKYINLYLTAQTIENVDSTINNLAQYTSASNGQGFFNARSSASDAAVATLKSKGWTITCGGVQQ